MKELILLSVTVSLLAISCKKEKSSSTAPTPSGSGFVASSHVGTYYNSSYAGGMADTFKVWVKDEEYYCNSTYGYPYGHYDTLVCTISGNDLTVPSQFWHMGGNMYISGTGTFTTTMVSLSWTPNIISGYPYTPHVCSYTKL